MFEAEVVEGLREMAEAELAAVFGGRVKVRGGGADAIRFRLKAKGDWERLHSMRLISAVYRVQGFDVPRPKSLLGHAHFQALLSLIAEVRSLWPVGTFQTLHLSAAGSDSAVFGRLKEELAAATGLQIDEEAGDLLLRVRRAEPAEWGWEVLVRLTARPLSVRPWRVVDMPGALHGCVAAAMNLLAGEGAHYLNVMCGSGSLLAERPGGGLGCDVAQAALAASVANVAAAGVGAQLVQADAASLPFSAASMDVVTADLPWGQLIGTHAVNEALYPAMLAEAARVVVRGGRCVLITHEVRLLEGCLAEMDSVWEVGQTVRLVQGNLRPRIYLLHRR